MLDMISILEMLKYSRMYIFFKSRVNHFEGCGSYHVLPLIGPPLPHDAPLHLLCSYLDGTEMIDSWSSAQDVPFYRNISVTALHTHLMMQ